MKAKERSSGARRGSNGRDRNSPIDCEKLRDMEEVDLSVKSKSDSCRSDPIERRYHIIGSLSYSVVVCGGTSLD